MSQKSATLENPPADLFPAAEPLRFNHPPPAEDIDPHSLEPTREGLAVFTAKDGRQYTVKATAAQVIQARAETAWLGGSLTFFPLLK